MLTIGGSMNRFLAAAMLSVCASSAVACGGTYEVQPGQTLSTIANVLYKDAGKWSDIHAANLDVIGEDASAVRAGQVLTLDCIDGLPILETPTAAPVVKDAPEVRASVRAQPDPLPPVRMITGGDMRPFTDAMSETGGMLTELVERAMTDALTDAPVETYWLANWAGQMDLILGGHAIEIGFPFAKPDCSIPGTSTLCEDYYFSEPMFEYLELLYIDAKRPLAFTQSADLTGRTLCRPDGHQMHILGADMQDSLENGAVTLERPTLVSECFFKLIDGDVDAVILNEFTAQQTLALMGLRDRVTPVSAKPIAVASLHAVIHKDHPEARRLRRAINNGLMALRADGRHHEVVARHLTPLWSAY